MNESNSLAVGANTSITSDTYQNSFSADVMKVIKDSIMPPGSTDAEMKYFIMNCVRTGLDPITRQIYPIRKSEWDDASKSYVNKIGIQVSIDGMRIIAERTGKYAGQEGPYWCGKDGVWKDVWLLSEPPVAAKVGVIRKDFSTPIWGVARFDAYAQTKKTGELTHAWKKMGDIMIAKCAESLAHRKAFPHETSNIYTTEEMGQMSTDMSITEQVRTSLPKPSAEVKPVPQTGNIEDDPLFSIGEVEKPMTYEGACGYTRTSDNMSYGQIKSDELIKMKAALKKAPPSDINNYKMEAIDVILTFRANAVMSNEIGDKPEQQNLDELLG